MRLKENCFSIPTMNTKYTVLYAQNTTKKVKRWLDGHVLYNTQSEKMTLYDINDSTVTTVKVLSSFIKDNLEVDIGRYIVQIGCENKDFVKKVEEKKITTSTNKYDQLGKTITSPTIKRNPVVIHKINKEQAIPKKHVDVLYTPDKNKKNKLWKDGSVCYFPNRKCVLYDSNMKRIDEFLCKNFEEIEETETGKHLIQKDAEPESKKTDKEFVTASELLRTTAQKRTKTQKPRNQDRTTKQEFHDATEGDNTNPKTYTMGRTDEEILSILP